MDRCARSPRPRRRYRAVVARPRAVDYAATPSEPPPRRTLPPVPLPDRFREDCTMLENRSTQSPAISRNEGANGYGGSQALARIAPWPTLDSSGYARTIAERDCTVTFLTAPTMTSRYRSRIITSLYSRCYGNAKRRQPSRQGASPSGSPRLNGVQSQYRQVFRRK